MHLALSHWHSQEQKTVDLKTPLHFAALQPKPAIMEAVLTAGGYEYLEEVDTKGNTALYYAVRSGNILVTAQLLSNGMLVYATITN